METWSRFCHLFPRKMDSFVGANEYRGFLFTFLPDFQDISRKSKPMSKKVGVPGCSKQNGSIRFISRSTLFQNEILPQKLPVWDIDCIRTLSRGGMYWEIHPPAKDREISRGWGFCTSRPKRLSGGNLEGVGCKLSA